MSKKKQPAKAPCKCRKKKILIPLLVILLIGVGFGIYRLATYNSTNQAGWMSKDEKNEYNSTITQRAWKTGRISQDEILILKTVNKNLGGDTQIDFYVYKLPQGAKATDYFSLEVSQISEDMGLTHVGLASCRLAGGNLKSITNLEIKYIR